MNNIDWKKWNKMHRKPIMVPLHLIWKWMTKKKKKVQFIEEFKTTHMSLGAGGLSVGGTAKRSEEKTVWVEREWWKKLKGKFR